MCARNQERKRNVRLYSWEKYNTKAAEGSQFGREIRFEKYEPLTITAMVIFLVNKHREKLEYNIKTNLLKRS